MVPSSMLLLPEIEKAGNPVSNTVRHDGQHRDGESRRSDANGQFRSSHANLRSPGAATVCPYLDPCEASDKASGRVTSLIGSDSKKP